MEAVGMRDFHLAGRSPVYATQAMAATAMPAATLTALDVLRAGGNAMDAAVAAVAVLGVIEPQSTGIGGDCFCLWAAPGKPVVALNGSGRAPAAATIDWYEQNGIAKLTETSPHVVTIPGAVGAWEALLAAHGTRGLDTVLQPAIRFAEEGWPVHSRVAWDWAMNAGKLRLNNATPFLPGGEAPKAGDVFVQKPLAETLRTIARQGARGFYEGAVAADIVATLRARGGLQTEEDFAAGRTAAEFVQPIHIPWRGYDVWQCPPNGSGLHVLMILGMLEGFEPGGDPLDAERLHRHIEAARLAYRDRDAFLADPAFSDVPVGRLTSPEYLAKLRALIQPGQAMRHMPAPGEAMLPVHKDTTYVCVVDRDGNACSFINSLFEGFGSGILAEKSGVMLQNRGFAFRLERGHPNCIAPNKRPMHTIIPGMVTKNGEAVMPYGVMGGHFQPMGQTLFLSNFLEYGLDIQQALDLPRLFPTKGKVELEHGIPQDLADRLARMGHDVTTVVKPHGGGQAIWIDRARGVLVGGSDPRKDGMALGY
jgi:gamma-glutamyltranspeptidase / glutathione hydrolase